MRTNWRSYGRAIRDVYRLRSINNSPIVELRISPQGILEIRYLTSRGKEFVDGGSDWRDCTMDDMVGWSRMNSPLWEWIRSKRFRPIS